jgi:TadE-like protein
LKTSQTRANQTSLKRNWKTVSSTGGAQLVELAVSLPLLIVVLVGIYDFGQALNLKQKLTAAAREGARFAANQSTLDLTNAGTTCGPAPASVCAVRDVIDGYLTLNGINDCGLATQNSGPASQWTWTFSSSCGGGSLVVTVNRGFAFPSSNGVTIEATQVQITYPYTWQFGRMFQLLASGANYTTTNIGTTAMVANMN